jgi:hypothetical protein
MSQKNFVSKMFTMGTRAVDGILTTFQSAKEQTKKSHDIVKREASIEMLTKMWNLAGSLLCLSDRLLSLIIFLNRVRCSFSRCFYRYKAINQSGEDNPYLSSTEGSGRSGS